MLGFGLVSVLAVYCGTRLHEKYKAKKERKKKEMLNAKPLKEVVPHKDSLELVKSQASIVSEEEKKATHYLKTSGGALALSFFTNTSPLIKLASLGVLGYSCVPNLEKAEKDLFQNKKLGHDVLNAIAFLGCVGFGYYSLAAFTCCSINFTYKVVERTRDSSKKMLTKVFDKEVDNVWVLRDGMEISLPLEAVRRHDIVVMKTGEAVSIDGIVTKGVGTIDQHLLTGESVPSEKEPGDHVFAGTLMVSGRIEVSVEKAGDDTTASKLGKILEQTTEFKTRHYLKGEEWVDKTSLPILCMSGLLLPVVGLSSSFGLIKSYPGGCARVSTSLHTLNHLLLSSRKGILVKDGRALEGLTEVDPLRQDGHID